MGHSPANARRRLLPRQRAGLAIHVAAALGLVPAFLLIAPPSRWNAGLLVVLGVLAVIADRSEVPVVGGVGFDGLIALTLVAVALTGPLPAVEVIVLPWVANVLTGRQRALRAGALANLVGYAWPAILAALVLRTAGIEDPTEPGALGWLMAAGFVLYTVGWAIHPLVYGTLWLGQPFQRLVQALVDMFPAAAIMLALAAMTVVLSAPLGLVALAMFAIIAILPQTYLTYAARTRPVARLDPATATRRYAHAIGLQLGLTRGERRHLADVVAIAQRRPPTGDAIDYVCSMLDDPSRANYDAQTITEWWNGSGAPLRLRGDGIPRAARVAAVAQTWAALTARGTPQLSHRDALEHLQAVAGARLDPAVVRAADAVIGQELVTVEQPAPEPRLHHLRVPTRVRRALTASAAQPGTLAGH